MHRGLNSASLELKHLVPVIFFWGSVGFAPCPACGVQPFPPAPRSSAIAQDFFKEKNLLLPSSLGGKLSILCCPGWKILLGWHRVLEMHGSTGMAAAVISSLPPST